MSRLVELASGEAVAPARIGDVSDRFGDTGLLSIRPADRGRAGLKQIAIGWSHRIA